LQLQQDVRGKSEICNGILVARPATAARRQAKHPRQPYRTDTGNINAQLSLNVLSFSRRFSEYRRRPFSASRVSRHKHKQRRVGRHQRTSHEKGSEPTVLSTGDNVCVPATRPYCSTLIIGRAPWQEKSTRSAESSRQATRYTFRASTCHGPAPQSCGNIRNRAIVKPKDAFWRGSKSDEKAGQRDTNDPHRNNELGGASPHHATLARHGRSKQSGARY
jgi:hypothetical protein